MKHLYTLFFIANALFALQSNAQNLLTQGSFDTGDNSNWVLTGGEIKTYDGGINYLYEANVEAAGDPWTTNLSYLIGLTVGDYYKLTFKANTGIGQSRAVIVGIGGNEAPFTSHTVSVDLTETPTTYSYVFRYNPGLNSNNEAYTSHRVLFDMGANAGVVQIDDVTLEVFDFTEAPAEAAPSSYSYPATNAFAMYSSQYDMIINPTSTEGWSESTVTADLNGYGYKITGNFAAYANYDDWDFTGVEKIEFDYWLETKTSGEAMKIFLKLVDTDASAEILLDFFPTGISTSAGSWHSVSFDLASFLSSDDSGIDMSSIDQILFDNTFEGGTFYVDNMVFSSSAALTVYEIGENAFIIYPNPVQNTLNVSAAATIDAVSIFDLTGRQVLRATPNAAAFTLDVADLNKGMYLVSLKSGDKEMTTKLVK